VYKQLINNQSLVLPFLVAIIYLATTSTTTNLVTMVTTVHYCTLSLQRLYSPGWASASLHYCTSALKTQASARLPLLTIRS